MRKTKERQDNISQSICVSREELAQMLGCGQATADRLSIEANARIKVGRRILIRRSKVEEYLDALTS